MDEVQRFFEAYLEAEHTAAAAVYTEPDDMALYERIAAAESFLHSTSEHMMSLGVGRPLGMTPDKLADLAADAGEQRPRPLYKLVRYEHPLYGDLYEAWVGPDSDTTSPRYSQRLFATRLGDDLKIISRYAASFPFEGPTTWEHLEGTVIDDPGTPAETSELVAVDDS